MKRKDPDTQEFGDDMARMDCDKFNTVAGQHPHHEAEWGEAFNCVSGVHDGCGPEAWLGDS